MVFRTFEFSDLSFLLFAAGWTLALALVSFGLGSLIALFVTLARINDIRTVRSLASVYINIIQSSPPLIQVFLIFFGIAVIGLDISPFAAATVALGINSSAYLGEMWRGAIQAVPSSQWQASASLGMTYYQQLRNVIWPQAFRIALPPTTGFAVQLIKNTSLASVVGLTELTRAAQGLSNITLQPHIVFAVTAMIYFALCFPLTLLSEFLEEKWNARN